MLVEYSLLTLLFGIIPPQVPTAEQWSMFPARVLCWRLVSHAIWEIFNLSVWTAIANTSKNALQTITWDTVKGGKVVDTVDTKRLL